MVWLEKHQLILLIMLTQLKLVTFVFHYTTQLQKLCCMLASSLFSFIFSLMFCLERNLMTCLHLKSSQEPLLFFSLSFIKKNVTVLLMISNYLYIYLFSGINTKAIRI